ncbi:MAG: DNA polymerase IV [Bacilli bacterium]
MRRVIVHIDLNTFFVRCEEIKNPSLIGKPVAVGHLGRCGIISTASYEARKFGVCSGMPTFKALEACPDLILIQGDYHYYSMMSHQFLKFISRYTKLIEQASCDELYADFTEQIKGVSDVRKYFEEIQQKLFDETGLKCSIGVSITKFLAKMGSDYKKPMGLTIIRKKDIPNMLFSLPIDNFFGIGKRTCPNLKKVGINTIGDLYFALKNDNETVKSIVGKFSYVILDWLEGKGDDVIDTSDFDPKSIGNSITMNQDSSNFDEIRPYIDQLAKEVSQRAIKEGKLGSTIQIVVKDINFVSHNKSITFINPTNSETKIYNEAIKLFEKNFMDMEIRLVGITLQNLIDSKDVAIQMTFYDFEQHEEENKTKLIINNINRKLNKPLLKRASELEKKD